MARLTRDLYYFPFRVEIVRTKRRLEDAFGAVQPKNRPEDFEAMIRDAKEEHAERTGNTCLRALALYAGHPIDFADALAAAHVLTNELDAIVSYDRDFDRIPRLVREEP